MKSNMKRKLIIFDNVTLDGYFSGPNGEFDWAHEGGDDPEFASFVEQNASGESQLLFGRKTYELMAAYWPTVGARRDNPTVAAGMNKSSKFVFSNTLPAAEWSNSKIVRGDMVEAVRQMKAQSGPDLVVLGSGSIVAQLSVVSLVDEYQMVINPLALGSGRTLFEGLPQPLRFKVKQSRTFRNGKTFLCLWRK
jgi:dihydrofolate reductase